MFDTQYDIQWAREGHLAGEAVRMPRTDLFRKKPVVTKPMLKAWIAEVATCETIQVCSWANACLDHAAADAHMHMHMCVHAMSTYMACIIFFQRQLFMLRERTRILPA